MLSESVAIVLYLAEKYPQKGFLPAFVAAYMLDMASVVQLFGALPKLRAYMERMYARPKAPQRIAQAFTAAAEEPARGCYGVSEADGDAPKQCEQVASVGCSPVEISIFKTSRPAPCDTKPVFVSRMSRDMSGRIS